MASVMRYDEGLESFRAGLFGDRRTADLTDLRRFQIGQAADASRSLCSLIEREIIPRLMVVHATGTDPVPDIGGSGINSAEIETFAPLVMQIEADALLVHVESILARGVSFDTLLVDLLAPTARLLGEYWEDDRCDFVDVTMGLWRLQEVVHEIAERRPATHAGGAGNRRALFAAMPGDQHDFGTVVVDELFRRDGWTTDRLGGVETPTLLKRAADGWFDVIGLTVSCACHIGDLPPLIVALRKVSRNPRVCVMVGGRIFSADPDLAVEIGADGTARDAKLAVRIAGDLVREREREAAACN